MFMGEKDHQQYFLIRNFISKKYTTKIYACKTIRDLNGIALSSRNLLLDNADIKTAGLIANKLIQLKKIICKTNNFDKNGLKKIKQIINKEKKKLIKIFNIKIEYMECRNLTNLSRDLQNKPFKLFISYYLRNVRLIDNF